MSIPLRKSVTGSTHVGGLVGDDDSQNGHGVTGWVTNCYTAGNVTGSRHVGGLIGDDSGSNNLIQYCYAAGNVSGMNWVGGIAGESASTDIKDALALNQVVQVTTGTNVGRITATSDASASIAYCYAWVGMTGSIDKFTSKTITGKDGADTTSYSVWDNKDDRFQPVGFDFTTVWTKGTTEKYKLPIHKGQAAVTFDATYLAPINRGAGTEGNPFLIKTLDELKKATADGTVNTYYKLDGDFSINDVDWNGIGTAASPFKGNFDGNGHTITLNDPTKNAGLFNVTDGANITKTNIVVATDLGATAGKIGGLVGSSAGDIMNSYAAGSVTTKGTGVQNVGGLVGILTGRVDTSYAAGKVTDTTNVGGLVGNLQNNGKLNNSVARNENVTGETNVNRVLGLKTGGTLENNFAFDGMLDKDGTKFASGTGSDEAGADVTAANLGTLSWWTAAAPTGPHFDANTWSMKDGQLVLKRQIVIDPPKPPVPPVSSGGDGNDGGISTAVVGRDGVANLGTGTGITGATFPAGTTGTLTIDRQVTTTAALPNGVKGSFATSAIVFPTFTGSADLHFSVPVAILIDLGLTVHDVTLARLTGTTWQTVPTSYLGTNLGAAQYTAVVSQQSGVYAILYLVNGAPLFQQSLTTQTAGEHTPTVAETAASTTRPTATTTTTTAAVTTGSTPEATLVQSPEPLAGLLLGLGAADLLLRRKE